MLKTQKKAVGRRFEAVSGEEVFMGDVELKKLDKVEIGRRVRVRREFLELSRDRLAEMIDVSPQFLSDIEYGHKGMSVKTLFALSQVLRISADFLLAGKVDQTEEKALQFREEINAMLDHFSEDQLKGVSGIIRIYEDGLTKK